jgi:cation transport regulator ChaC
MRPTALLVYGSLMHPDELARHPTLDPTGVPVRLRGFQRSFCQEPSWRECRGRHRGVLTVRRSADHWLNALLVRVADPAALRSLDDRERGYARVRVSAADVVPYARTVDATHEIGVYVGRAGNRNDSLLPNRDYLLLCTAAATTHGDVFLHDFLATTFVGDVPLRPSQLA